MSVFLKKGFLFLIVMFVLAFLVFSFVRTEATSSQSAPDFGNIFSLFSLPGQEIGGYEVEAYFCPEDECSSKLIAELDKAQSTIQIAIYSFTLDDIADALIRAKKRGVEVRVVFDDGQSKSEYSEDERLVENGVEIERRNGSGLMHNKFAVIDGNVVATGSFNYSSNADTKNDENLVFIRNKIIAQKYADEFEELWAQAK